MQRTQISLTEAERRLLDGVSQRTGHSLSQLIRAAVDEVYGGGSPDTTRAVLDASFGAWADDSSRTGEPGGTAQTDGAPGGPDGAGYVEQLRSGRRLSPSR